jgi:hypothetical protein
LEETLDRPVINQKGLSKRELERRLSKLASAYNDQRQANIQNKNLLMLLAAKLYLAIPTEDIFKSFNQDHMKAIESIAEGLKQKNAQVLNEDYSQDTRCLLDKELSSSVKLFETTQDLMPTSFDATGTYNLEFDFGDKKAKIHIPNRPNSYEASRLLTDAQLLQLLKFHNVIKDDHFRSLTAVSYHGS